MDIREEFEKVDGVKNCMAQYGVSFENASYNSPFSHINEWLNGAWYAFQEQQKKADAIKSKLSDIYDASDEGETVEHLLDEIQELLK
jgi:predicted HNH restriction endonuclease